MFLVILIILWIEYFLVPKKNLFTFIGFLLLFYLFFNTHSRMPLAFLFLSFLAYYFFKEKRAFKFLKSLMMILLVFFGLYLLVAKTDVSPRLKKLVVSENAFKDPSSNTRFVIIENSVLEMTTFEKTIGIGLGGFNDFYFGISNKDGVAAHNNFLLFFAEGGIIGLFLFIVYQIVLFRTLFRFIRKPPIIDQKVNYQRMIFVSVFLLEICSFLLNNYYFFTSQTIVFILIGLLMYLEVYKIKPHNLKIANGSQA
ncbi:O-antigen ligase family protein [Maribacter cobaltidurans]|uniref:O-antigen ligase family protein n=1 Tax=Maribacter cobaltidurans TaxID=1178778 RepID=A0ABU7IRI0_9FLAO|nr:O-antigen ligase family protein [Maribacter cobaltidurans]MEE1975181.1 O-antigen ligase family protein [Maribacter cobaltidurans]